MEGGHDCDMGLKAEVLRLGGVIKMEKKCVLAKGSNDLCLRLKLKLILVNWGGLRIRVLGFKPQGWDLDNKPESWASRLGFGLQG